MGLCLSFLKIGCAQISPSSINFPQIVSTDFAIGLIRQKRDLPKRSQPARKLQLISFLVAKPVDQVSGSWKLWSLHWLSDAELSIDSPSTFASYRVVPNKFLRFSTTCHNMLSTSNLQLQNAPLARTRGWIHWIWLPQATSRPWLPQWCHATTTSPTASAYREEKSGVPRCHMRIHPEPQVNAECRHCTTRFRSSTVDGTKPNLTVQREYPNEKISDPSQRQTSKKGSKVWFWQWWSKRKLQ